MDDLEKKDGIPEGAEGEEPEKKPEEITPEENSEAVSEDAEEEQELSEKEKELNELDAIVNSIRVKNEADILKNNVQDWSGLVDESKQEAEEFIFDESQSFSDEKLEAIEKMEIDEDDETLCCICHRRAKLVKDGVEYEYCGRCRKELIDKKYNWKSVVTFILSIGVAALTVVIGFIASANMISVYHAKKLTYEGKLTSASNYYRNILDEVKENSAYETNSVMSLFTIDLGEKTARDFLDLEYRLGFIHNVSEDIQSYFPSIDLNKKSNAVLKQYVDEYQDIYDLSMSVNTMIQEFQSKKNPTVDELKKVLEELEKNKKDAGDMKSAFTSYYQYYVCLSVDNTEDLQLKYLNEIMKKLPDAKWMYQMSLAQVNLMQNNNSKCIKICNDALADNSESMEAYRMKMKALYRDKKYDEALKVSKQAIEAANGIVNSNSEEQQSGEVLTNDLKYASNIYYEQAIIYCLKGDMQLAQKSIENSYKGNPRSLEGAYVYCLINKLNGNDEAYNDLYSQMTQYGYELPDNAKKLIEGKTSFEEVFVNGKAAWY